MTGTPPRRATLPRRGTPPRRGTRPKTRIRAGDLTTNFQRLHAEGAGQAPLVVFVHGLLTDSLASYYFTLAPDIAAAGIDVLMYDLRGHGRSDRPSTGYRLEAFVDDLAALLDALDEHRQVHVVGNSFGGTIAAGLAAWHPDRVATVTMIESEPPVAAWTGHMAAGLADAKSRLAEEVVIGWIEANHGEHTARLSRNASHILATTTLAEDIPHSRVIDDDLSAITCPLLAVFGDESGLSGQVADLGAALDDCTTVVLLNQGHSVLIERPTETRDLVLDFVLKNSGPRL